MQYAHNITLSKQRLINDTIKASIHGFSVNCFIFAIEKQTDECQRGMLSIVYELYLKTSVCDLTKDISKQ